MKKFSKAIFTLFIAGQASAALQPARFSYEKLVGSGTDDVDSTFLEALQFSGLISLTDVDGLNKQEMLAALHECVTSSHVAVKHTYQDGTVRRTLASQTYQGEKETMKHGDSKACQSFETASEKFSALLSHVTQAFSDKLASVMKPLMTDDNEPLLLDESGLANFATVSDVVRSGQHLEHFHSYEAPSSSSATGANDEDKTIEWHTDQGLFIVFTPGQIDGQVPKQGGFYIELPDGSKEEVEFKPEDDVVIMLGDGVDQYLNPKYTEKLRSSPHALVMPETDSPRLWYGRMVLPPPNAMHPIHKRTFGDLRRAAIAKDDAALSLGCSSSRRALNTEDENHEGHNHDGDDEGCGEGASYCWHRCMTHADFNVTEESCVEESLIMGCADEAGHKWPCTHNSTFGLRCLSSDADYPPEFTDVDPEDCEAPEPTAAPAAAPTGSPTASGGVGVRMMMKYASFALVAVSTVSTAF